MYDYRRIVERIWSKKSIHPDYDFDGGPTGQCGVTAAWLMEVLLEEEGLETFYCEGIVIEDDEVISDHHCWLEVADGQQLDVTWDQFGEGPNSYWAKKRLTLAEVRNSPVWRRVEIMKRRERKWEL